MNFRKREIKRKKIKNARSIGRTNTLIKTLENRVCVSNSEMDLMFLTPAIYFLYKDDKIVYVGETTSVMKRISQHINDTSKVFDSFSFDVFTGSNKERKHKERLLIKKLQPVYNIQHAVVKVVSNKNIKGCNPDLIPGAEELKP